MVKLLVDSGANVNLRNTKEGWTALIYCVENGFADMVEYLVLKGANPHETDREYRWSALSYASYIGDEEMVSFLLDRGADVSAVDNEGHNALLIACTMNEIETMRILIDKGSNVNTTDSNGVSAILLAHSLGFSDAVQLLRDKGADYSLIEKTNQCVLEKICTANASDEQKMIGQKIFECTRCKVKFCVVCKEKCHSSHKSNVSEIEFGLLRCECGGKGVACKAENNKAGKSVPNKKKAVRAKTNRTRKTRRKKKTK